MPIKSVNKVGRPKLPEGESLNNVIPAIRCKTSEREAFEKAAKRQGLKLGEWIRQVLNKAVKE